MVSAEKYEVIYTLRSELFTKKRLGDSEKKVFLKYRKKGARRGVFGGLMGALGMAGVWKIAALGTAFGITGVLVGGLLGAWMALRASRLRLKMTKKMFKLPDEKSPLAAEAREILRTKLPRNVYAKKLLKMSEFARLVVS
ncbi:hypothetical protein PInf_021833 [Phytophthora infestans]|nr:hypothetical protein PInf_021833 [Phytophthora infestans]